MTIHKKWFRTAFSCRQPLLPEEIKRIPFKELVPLRLENSIDRKIGKEADVTCLQEMAVMFACMKDNNFKEVECSQEITTFLKCYNENTARKKAAKEREDSGVQVTGTNVRKLTLKQVNQLLQKYPQFNK